MCILCATTNPFLSHCSYEALPQASAEEIAAGPAAPQGITHSEDGDAAGNTFTQASMGAGTYFEGNLSSTFDSDWIAVELVAGQTYTFAAMGLGALGDRATDLDMYLRNETGVQLVYDDGLAGDYNPAITYTAATSGTYYIDIQNWQGTASNWTLQAGAYGVSMTLGDKASYSDAMGAGNLLNTLNAWTSEAGTGVNVTWSVRASGTDAGGNPLEVLDAQQVQLALDVTSYITAISGLDLTQVAAGGTSNDATIRIGAYSSSTDGAGAYAYYPGQNGGNTASSSNAGDIWLNNNSYSGGSYDFGRFNHFAIMHEFGHAIGLPHPGGYNAGPGVSITYNSHAEYIQDTHQYTVMSYFDESNSGASAGWDYPDTFMLHDYLALHALYGADAGYLAGDTTFGFNATSSGTAYDFTANSNPFMCIYDGAGTDTIDLSGYGMGNWLSLEAGVFSNVGGAVGRFSIAYGAVIENAVGGSGDDTLTGNDVANQLTGGAGSDTLSGGLGDDHLMGGDANDRLLGEDGADRMQGGHGNDVLLGGTGHDRLLGGTGRDLLSGGNGNDTIMGEIGNDRLFGGNGNDLMSGGNNDDFLFGAAGEDRLIGGAGDDVLRGGFQSDALDGGAGADALFGGGGFDTLAGGAGDDVMVGGGNADTFIFTDGHGHDTVSDFDAGNEAEVLDFSGLSTFNSLADVLGSGAGTAAASQQGNAVIIDTGTGSIRLENTLYEDLDASDFLF